MNLENFRKFLKEKEKKLHEYQDEFSPGIQAGRFDDSLSIWSNPELVPCGLFDGRSAYVIFPESVNLLTTSIFYDRVYFELSYPDLKNDQDFFRHYKLRPKELLHLVKLGRVVPRLGFYIGGYSDYLLKEFLYPLITNELPYLTFQGQALIVQIWQTKYQAFPDPQDSTWGFLLSLVGAMGIGANLVRPEMSSDIWQRHTLIFDVLGFGEIAKYFIDKEITLEDFFIAVDIYYDSTLPLSEYLYAFDQIDKEKLFSLYKSLDKTNFYQEIQNINIRTKEIARHIDQEHLYRKVLTAPVAFAFYLATETLKTLLGPVAGAIDRLTEGELEKCIKRVSSEFGDLFADRWQATVPWVKEDQFPQVLELVKLKRILENQVKP